MNTWYALTNYIHTKYDLPYIYIYIYIYISFTHTHTHTHTLSLSLSNIYAFSAER